ncbi:hypothetical protein N7467_009233 [Penicillium canescens]|nr:hypothetical protein N7467_009233 [Penicillium canescens]
MAMSETVRADLRIRGRILQLRLGIYSVKLSRIFRSRLFRERVVSVKGTENAPSSEMPLNRCLTTTSKLDETT